MTIKYHPVTSRLVMSLIAYQFALLCTLYSNDDEELYRIVGFEVVPRRCVLCSACVHMWSGNFWIEFGFKTKQKNINRLYTHLCCYCCCCGNFKSKETSFSSKNLPHIASLIVILAPNYALYYSDGSSHCNLYLPLNTYMNMSIYSNSLYYNYY